MRRVFNGAVEGEAELIETGVKAHLKEVRGMRDDMATKADLDTTNENVRTQSAHPREDVRADIWEAVKSD